MNADDRELGMHVAITRRDFVNAVAMGSGAALLTGSAGALANSTDGSAQISDRAAEFNGFGGVGDYQRSNGNTWDVVQAAHKMRDGRFANLQDVHDTNETHDVVVVGGGFAGMGAAHHMMRLTDGRKSCLVLENHPLWGGEAKRNEFLVDGTRLMGPQGSNDFGVPRAGTIAGEVWNDLRLPREFAYSELAAGSKSLQFSKTNFDHQLWLDNFESHGFWFPEVKRWVTNPWGHDLAGVPWPDELKRDFLRWRKGTDRYYPGLPGPEYDRYLDSMSYEHYLTHVMGLRSEVARYTDPILAASGGLGSDVTSAYLAAQFLLPGFQGMNQDRFFQNNHRLDSDTHGQRFPGGNDAIMRALLKRLLPASINGSSDFAEIHNGAVRFDQLDRLGQSTRIRLAAMTVDVRHTGTRDETGGVDVTYALGGRLHRVHARAAVICTGSWVAKHIVRGLPVQHMQALQQFYRSPMLVLNVALTNWRPLYELGYTAASWRGGFGFTFNLAPPMRIGKFDSLLDPDRPAVITFYVPVMKVGRPIEQQGPAARAEVLTRPYREYEYLVRAQLTEMLGPHGFDPRRDIAGIILNRWGHAYVDPYPGFFFGKDGKPAPSEVIRQPFGRISFGHSELRGHQYWNGGLEEGRRAMEQALQQI